MHWYKRNIGDYHKKAGRLSILQHGVYNMLIDACYDREQFPSFDEAKDWIWISTEEEEQALRFVLGKFFQLVDGVYIQKRISEEIDAYHAKAEQNKKIALEREKRRRESRRENNALKKEHESCSKRARSENSALKKEHESTPNQEPITSNHKPRTINQEPNIVSPPLDAVVHNIFAYWQKVMKKGAAKLSVERKRCIEARLKDGYEIDFIKKAIDSCSKSKHHMGFNDRGTVYNDLTLICRSGSKLEYFANDVAKITEDEVDNEKRGRANRKDGEEDLFKDIGDVVGGARWLIDYKK